jgi:hypothetical protein
MIKSNNLGQQNVNTIIATFNLLSYQFEEGLLNIVKKYLNRVAILAIKTVL